MILKQKKKRGFERYRETQNAIKKTSFCYL